MCRRLRLSDGQSTRTGHLQQRPIGPVGEPTVIGGGNHPKEDLSLLRETAPVIDLIPMTEPLLDQAATLLADAWSERHETGCRSVLGHVTTARHRVEGTLSIPAVAAVRDGNLVGFLGARPPRPPSQSVAMKAAMHATTRENRREIYRALYGQLAGELTAIGGFAHTVAVNAKDLETVSAWFELGFGLDQVRGVQAVPQVPSNRAPQDVHVRLAA